MPSGRGLGEPLVLREWQKDEIRAIIDPVNDDGTRRIRLALWSMARKNGKTALAAALLLCALCGPLAVRNGEVYSAATTRDQAAQVYKMAAQMVRLDPELDAEQGGILTCLDTGKRIVCKHLGAFYQALAAEAGSVHGQNPHFVIYDELAQASNRELYDVLSTSMDAQPNAILLVISTQSSDPASIMSELSDDAIAHQAGVLDDPSFYGRVFMVPLLDENGEETDPFDESLWPLANPALGDFKMLHGMRAQAEKAKRSPGALLAFRNLHLNQRVDTQAGFVNSADWLACNQGGDPDADLTGRRCFLALDLSGKRDLSSLLAVFPDDDDETAEVRAWHWTPAEDIAEREKRDGARYREWAADGWLEIVNKRTIDFATIARKIAELHGKYKIQMLAADSWKLDHLLGEFDQLGIDPDEVKLEPFGQGFKSMSPAVDDLEEFILDHKVFPDGNPILTYCMGNVRILMDPAGNRKFDKRQKNKRIDGAVTLAMAISTWRKSRTTEDAGPSVYETRGVLAF